RFLCRAVEYDDNVEVLWATEWLWVRRDAPDIAGTFGLRNRLSRFFLARFIIAPASAPTTISSSSINSHPCPVRLESVKDLSGRPAPSVSQLFHTNAQLARYHHGG